jgi:hypothetical protein
LAPGSEVALANASRAASEVFEQFNASAQGQGWVAPPCPGPGIGHGSQCNSCCERLGTASNVAGGFVERAGGEHHVGCNGDPAAPQPSAPSVTGGGTKDGPEAAAKGGIPGTTEGKNTVEVPQSEAESGGGNVGDKIEVPHSEAESGRVVAVPWSKAEIGFGGCDYTVEVPYSEVELAKGGLIFGEKSFDEQEEVDPFGALKSADKVEVESGWQEDGSIPDIGDEEAYDVEVKGSDKEADEHGAVHAGDDGRGSHEGCTGAAARSRTAVAAGTAGGTASALGSSHASGANGSAEQRDDSDESAEDNGRDGGALGESKGTGVKCEPTAALPMTRGRGNGSGAVQSRSVTETYYIGDVGKQHASEHDSKVIGKFVDDGQVVGKGCEARAGAGEQRHAEHGGRGGCKTGLRGEVDGRDGRPATGRRSAVDNNVDGKHAAKLLSGEVAAALEQLVCDEAALASAERLRELLLMLADAKSSGDARSVENIVRELHAAELLQLDAEIGQDQLACAAGEAVAGGGYNGGGGSKPRRRRRPG